MKQFTDADYVDLNTVFNNGSIAEAGQLVIYAVMLNRPRAYMHLNAQYEPACNLVNTMIAVRLSERQDKQSTRLQYVGLFVGVASLVASALQVWLAVK